MYFYKYTAFGVTADWKAFGDARKSVGEIDLSGITPTVIRAEDFVDSSGDPEHMPVVAYGGHNVGSLVNMVSYYFLHSSETFGNMHLGKIEGIVVVDYPLTNIQRIYMYPRGSSGSYICPRLGIATFDLWYKALNYVLTLNAGYVGRKPLKDEWRSWQWHILNKYFFNNSFKSASDVGAFLHSSYDPNVVNPGNPKGYFRCTEWTQNETYIRSPGREFEDTDNPGILQLWPMKAGYVLPYNAKNKYITLPESWVTNHYANGGSLGINFKTYCNPEGKYLCTVSFDGNTDISTPPYYGIGINETEFGMNDQIALGGFATFPDSPNAPPKRIGAVNNSEIFFVEDMSGVLLTGDRMNIYTVPLFIINAPYPINESAPSWLPIPMSGDITDYYDPNEDIFVVNAKNALGIFVNNYSDPIINPACNEIILSSDQNCFMDFERIVDPETNPKTDPAYDIIEDSPTKIEDLHDEGIRDIFKFLNS